MVWLLATFPASFPTTSLYVLFTSTDMNYSHRAFARNFALYLDYAPHLPLHLLNLGLQNPTQSRTLEENLHEGFLWYHPHLVFVLAFPCHTCFPTLSP